jgi:hypothetical protein
MDLKSFGQSTELKQYGHMLLTRRVMVWEAEATAKEAIAMTAREKNMFKLLKLKSVNCSGLCDSQTSWGESLYTLPC